MNDYLIWAIDKYLETHKDMKWDKAADYVAEHVEELGEEFSIDAYLKEHPEAERLFVEKEA